MIYSTKLINARKIKKLEDISVWEKEFLEILLLNTPKCLHERIKAKLKDIKIDVKYDLTSSEYIHENNTILLDIRRINDFDVYLHEIMHAIGTECVHGFRCIGLNKRYDVELDDKHVLCTNFGYGANEGLNQHYTEKFLPLNKRPSEVITVYNFCANIMSSLEKLVGEDDCKIAHLSGKGIDYLINAMQKVFYLNNENKALKFILQLDTYMRVSITHNAFGVTHTPDTRLLLTECYKTLLSLALRKAKSENKEINFSQIISLDHLSAQDFSYFTKYIQQDLIKYFYNTKQYLLKHKSTNFVGLKKESILYYSEILYNHFLRNNNFENVNLPEEIKCGEFYNHILLNCAIYDRKGYKCGILTNDFARSLTIQIFKRNTNLVPNKKSELVQMVRQILASRNTVRCGATIDDDHIISSTEDVDFNIFLMDTAPQTYKEILPYISLNIICHDKILPKIFEEILTTKYEKYKFIKSLPKQMLENETIKQQLENIKNELQNHK